MPSSLLSLISEGHSPPHAFSSASPKQGSRTHFNTSESLYTTDSQAAAVMYISEQPLLWGVCLRGVLLRRRLTQFDVNLDTCFSYLRLNCLMGKNVDFKAHWILGCYSSTDLVRNSNFFLGCRKRQPTIMQRPILNSYWLNIEIIPGSQTINQP